MKAIISLSALILLVALTTSAPSFDLYENDDAKELYTNQQEFVINILIALSKNGIDTFAFSPHTIYHTLLLSYFGGVNNTETHIKNGLRMSWAKTKLDVIRAYLETKKARQQATEFDLFDRIYVSDKAKLGNTLTSKFTNQVEQVDFSGNFSGIIEHMNDLFQKFSKDQFKKFYVNDDVRTTDNLLLASGVSFKAQWANQFDKSQTENKAFFGSNGEEKTVPYMKLKGQFVTGEAFNASFVKLPFANSNEQLSLYVFMPLEKTPTALDDFLYDLKMLKNFNEVFEIDTKDEISVELPRFTAESRFRHALNFGHILATMGISNVFRYANYADFTQSMKLKLDNIKHRAVLTVDEEGSNFVSGTGSFNDTNVNETLWNTAASTTFISDHSFFYVIYDHAYNEILFAGVYRGPE